MRGVPFDIPPSPGGSALRGHYILVASLIAYVHFYTARLKAALEEIEGVPLDIPPSPGCSALRGHYILVASLIAYVHFYTARLKAALGEIEGGSI